MTAFRHHLRLSLVALAAVMGMLSWVSDVSASPATSVRRDGVRSCCLKRACNACCCAPSRGATAERVSSGRPSLLSFAGVGMSNAPAFPCECRTNDPATPAPKPGTRSDERRPNQGCGEPVDRALGSEPALRVDRLAPAAASRPEFPLYLRNARLLI